MKIAKLLSVSLCLVLTLTACGNGNSSNETKETTVTLGTYKGVEVSLTPVEVTDEEVQAQIDTTVESSGAYTEYTDRTDVQDGDVVNIDYSGSVDGTKFDNGTATGQALTIGSGQFVDDFEQQLIGHKSGESLDVNVTFPTEYSEPTLAGKDAVFEVTINSVGYFDVEKYVTENTEYKTVDEYKQSVYDSLLESEQSTYDSNKEMEVIQAVIDDSKFNNLSQDEIDEAVESMNSYYEQMATSYGMDFATLISYFGMDEETFASEIKKAGELQVKEKYVLEAIVKAENLTLTDEEYQTGLSEYATSSGAESPEDFETENGKEKIQAALLNQKAIDLVVESAVITDKAEDAATSVTPTEAATK